MLTGITKEAAINAFLDTCRQLSYYNAAEGNWSNETVARNKANIQYREAASILAGLGINPSDITKGHKFLL